ncbi:hypothetical protein [Kitasatospora sp. NPDC057738]|uniref:hypothetical protein n=1 Tax=Kitasatospora sp. NPDC057738 TaxID=3346233 RepID=UPI0036B01694
MTVHTRREMTIRRVAHVLPTPAVGADLGKAWRAAQADYRRDFAVDPNRMLPDDALTVTVGDNEVVISYEVTVKCRDTINLRTVLGQDGGEQ